MSTCSQRKERARAQLVPVHWYWWKRVLKHFWILRSVQCIWKLIFKLLSCVSIVFAQTQLKKMSLYQKSLSVWFYIPILWYRLNLNLCFYSADPVSYYNPLHIAVLRNKQNMVRLLVGHGADIEKRDRVRQLCTCVCVLSYFHSIASIFSAFYVNNLLGRSTRAVLWISPARSRRGCPACWLCSIWVPTWMQAINMVHLH